MLFDISKRKVSIKPSIDILTNRINSLNLEEEERSALLQDLKGVVKAFEKTEFIIRRTKVDKNIATNLLKQNLETLQNKNKIIEEQIAFKEQILANVNHELRTPLNAIIGICDLLQETFLTTQQQEYTDLIKRSGDSLFIIINDFLTISSMKAGKFELRLRPFSIREIGTDLKNIFALQAENRAIDLILEDSPISEQIFLGDPTRIHQICQNLVNNAIKFTKDGSVTLRCNMHEDLGDKKLIRFEIEDTGVGIPIEKQPKIFESFMQAHTVTEKGYSGTGLGLSIVKSLVDLMGGDINFESKEGVGTKFIVDIPFEQIKTHNITKENKIKRLSIADKWKEYRYLMIEDNPANIFYAKELFKRWGLNIEFAETYTDGLTAANSSKYDLILCDLNLPDGYGIDLVKEIRNNKKSKSNQSKIAIITASILQSDKDKAAELGLSGFVEKPFSAQTLLKEMHLIFGEQIVSSNEIPKKQTKNTPDILKGLNKISSNPKVHFEFLNIFLRQFKVDSAQLAKSIDDINYEEIYQTAHKMKSSIKYFDVDMYKQISALEKYGYEKTDYDTIKSEYELFSQRVTSKIPLLEDAALKLEQQLADNSTI